MIKDDILILTAVGCSAFIIARFVFKLRLIGELRAFLRSRESQIDENAKKDNDNNKITILTHNVWAHILSAPLRLQRLRLLIGYLRKSPHIDVVCLQELFILKIGPFVRFAEFEYVATEMRKLGFVHETDASESLNSNWWLPFQSSGLATFSRLPIRSGAFEKFSSTLERLNNKGFETMELMVGSVAVTLINTHLDSRGGLRMKQIEQLGLTAVRARVGTTALICCGDFNVDSNRTANSEFKFLAGSLNATDVVDKMQLGSTRRASPPKVAVLAQLVIGFPQPKWRLGSMRTDCLDHVFIRNGSTMVATKAELVDINDAVIPLSDHLGVLVTVS